ncbi:MAG: hypothetical protein KA716_32065 [Gloeotrichia echinulata DEX184]|nr:hypothetical protein [Gloeotrichia echinulata DEX184]
MDTIAKGGRGHKAPYTTTHTRIPEGIKPVVENLVTEYRQKFVNDINPDTNGAAELLERLQAAITPTSPTLEERLNSELVEAKNENSLLKEQCRIQQEKLEAMALEAVAIRNEVSNRTVIDYQAVRDRYLSRLKLGKQSPEYKRAKQHIEAFINELQS